MKAFLKVSIVVFISLFFGIANAQYASLNSYKSNIKGSNSKIDFTEWSTLLRRNTSVKGTIDYSGFKQDKTSFDRFVKVLTNTKIANNWTQDERKAYWINVYNTFSVKLVMDNFPIKSINELDKPFKKEFFEINREMMSLNDVEEILASFNDPRLLLVLNRNSTSGVRLIKRAYTANNLDEMLDKRVRLFVNNPQKNSITGSIAQLSPLFKKYEKEFSKSNYVSVKQFINLYSNTVIKDQKIVFSKFNQEINSYQVYGK